jgi:basic membrane lipoprotein Med (substrate-binding protein (PBP1-ABC) superfamily)
MHMPAALQSRNRRIALGAVVAVLVIAPIVIWTTADDQPIANNVSRNFRACLLTATPDATDARTAQAVWTGLQKAASTGKVNSEHLPLTVVAPAAAQPYFNGAIAQHCGLVVSVGTAMAPAVEAAAAANPHQHFLLVGAPSTRPNIASLTVPATKDTAAEVTTYVMRHRSLSQ